MGWFLRMSSIFIALLSCSVFLHRRIRFVAFSGILLFNGFSTCFEQVPKYSFLNQATSAPASSAYDYIIIGGGTAGCPLAATLSQNATVLLLERGGTPYGNTNITYLSSFGKPLIDVTETSPSQRFVSEDGVINARARVLGGGSCINAGFYTRAAADYIAAAGWDPKLVNESYQWVEKMVAFQPEVKQWQSAVRDGLLEVGVGPYNGFTYEHLVGTKVGGSIFDADGERHTAADLLKYADPKRLTVLLHATVYKILFRHRGRKRPVAAGVVFRDARGNLHRAYLNPNTKDEVIISAGALGSPQLLMLSGVGPSSHLQSNNISLVLDQPLVGQGMSDNPMNAIFVPSPKPVEISLIQVVGITSFGSYIEAASGENFTPTSSFSMLSPKIGQLWSVPPKQRTPEAIARAAQASDDAGLQGGFILEKIIGPLSKGYLKLRSKNPNENPSVTFNYFKEREDLQRCVQGVKVIQSVIASKAFSEFRYDVLPPQIEFLLNITGNSPSPINQFLVDSALESFCKDTVMTIWHYHGGCQVGKVVDSEYKVIGVDSLRVVDGSTFHDSPGTNPQATVMMLGRYVGVKILQDRFKV